MRESTLKQELLEILCCPACRGDLDYSKTQSTLRCQQCGTIYPVKDGIPIMLTEDVAKSQQ